MTSLRLTLRAQPPCRLDLSPLVPERLARLDRAAIEQVVLGDGRDTVRVGDLFRVRMGDAGRIEIRGSSARFDRVGAGMTGGALRLDGACGVQAGRGMTGGRLEITGDAGPFAASGLAGGMVEIHGDAGDFLGGPLAGEIEGMRGGTVIVHGAAGDRAGDRLRRGVIVIEGRCGAHAGSRMIAGTLVVCGLSAAGAGTLMRRGTLVLGRLAAPPGPTFVPTGGDVSVFARLLAESLRPFSVRAARLVPACTTRLSGDMAALGKGEIMLRAAA